jgi:hypothetical protein
VTQRPARPVGRRMWSLAVVLTALLGAAAMGAPAVGAPPTQVARPARQAGVPAATVPRGSVGTPRAEGEVSTRRYHRPRTERVRRQAPPRPSRVRPRGQLTVVPGSAQPSMRGPAVTFLIEVEKGITLDRAAFAATVQRILYDRRGWRVPFRRVDSEPVDFRVALATPRTTDRLCAPLDTSGRFSCHQKGRAVLNLWRWRHGARSYGRDLRGYRTYLVNHEVGHALGHSWHRTCPHPGAAAPVMMQQTLGIGRCSSHPWPRPEERAFLH